MILPTNQPTNQPTIRATNTTYSRTTITPFVLPAALPAPRNPSEETVYSRQRTTRDARRIAPACASIALLTAIRRASQPTRCRLTSAGKKNKTRIHICIGIGIGIRICICICIEKASEKRLNQGAKSTSQRVR